MALYVAWRTWSKSVRRPSFNAFVDAILADKSIVNAVWPNGTAPGGDGLDKDLKKWVGPLRPNRRVPATLEAYIAAEAKCGDRAARLSAEAENRVPKSSG
jgi:hypothetical protein